MQTAMYIALRAIKKPPTVGMLMSNMGMSRATAYRWVGAYNDMVQYVR